MNAERQLVRQATIAAALLAPAAAILFNSLRVLVLAAQQRDIPWDDVRWSLFSSVWWILVGPIVATISLRLPLSRRRLVTAIVMALVGGFALSIAVEVASISFMLYARGLDLARDRVVRAVTGTGLTFNLVLLNASIVAGVGLRIDASRRERAASAARLRADVARAQLEALTAQIRPHFLFNTLNAISALIADEPETASTMTRTLSRLFRMSLESGGEQTVSLRREIEFVQAYVAIEKIRFESRLDVRFDIESEALEAMVPNYLLQPIVENSIKHGIGDRHRPGSVLVRASLASSRLRIEVSDDGCGITGAQLHEGIGLANTRRRLSHLYGDAAQLLITTAKPAGTIVRIELPLTAPGLPT